MVYTAHLRNIVEIWLFFPVRLEESTTMYTSNDAELLFVPTLDTSKSWLALRGRYLGNDDSPESGSITMIECLLGFLQRENLHHTPDPMYTGKLDSVFAVFRRTAQKAVDRPTIRWQPD